MNLSLTLFVWRVKKLINEAFYERLVKEKKNVKGSLGKHQDMKINYYARLKKL